MNEALWFVLLAWSARSYDARPQSFLLFSLWVWSYLYVWAGGHFNAVPALDVLAFVLSTFVALRWSRGWWSWGVALLHLAYLLAYAAQWAAWFAWGEWYGETMYLASHAIFTAQCMLCCVPREKPRRPASPRKG